MTGIVIRQLRKQSGMTREDLATAVGVSWETIHSLELGRRNPSPKTLVKLAEVLKTTPEVLTDSVVISKAEYERLLTNQK